MDKELLTTREVQSLVRLNRVTIYRLIREGEFPAIKVGGQWRFPRKAVEAWLNEQSSPQRPQPQVEEATRPLTLDEIFTHSELKPVLKAFAEATGLSVVVIDNQGNPLADCMECNPFCSAIQQMSTGQKACFDIHRQPTNTGGELLSCHAGLYYLAAPIELNGEPAAQVVMGPFVIDEAHLLAIQESLPIIASKFGADLIQLQDNLHTVQQVSPEQARLLGRLLSRVVNVITQLAYERSAAARRLYQIGQLVERENVSRH
jgi:excisionase family DNA binding protein